MDSDITFREHRMRTAIAEMDAALQADPEVPIYRVFNFVTVVEGGNHFILSIKPETTNAIADTVCQLWELQQGKAA